MFKSIGMISVGLSLALSSTAFAAPPGDPCEPIVTACKNAGFVVGDSRQGYGVFADCFDPIIGAKPPSNDTKRIPAVAPETVAACKAARARK